MQRQGVVVDLRHAPQLCYAMQQSAVPWLFGLAIENAGPEPLRDLAVRIELEGFSVPHESFVAEVPAGGRCELAVPDLALSASAFASLVERQRADLVVELQQGEQSIVRTVRAIDVLAYNEWPGLGPLAALVAAFVLPNHPALVPVLHDVSARLGRATGNPALDGYQSGDPARVRAMLAAVYDALCAASVRYVSPPPSFERAGQKVRTPEQVFGERFGTCLDLTFAAAALLEHIGLDPLVVLQKEHAFVGVWLASGSTAEVEVGPAVELRKACAAGQMAVLECTSACAVPSPAFLRASAMAVQRLDDDAAFVVAVDVSAARRAGVRPLPLRSSTYQAIETGSAPAVSAPSADLAGADSPPSAPPAPPPPRGGAPSDRLEHWQQKLLDLSMFNRLLNFVETKKTVRLAAHDLAAIEDRLQGGARLRLAARPRLGGVGEDPRDLALQQQRSGEDVLQNYLAEELRAGRLRTDLEQEELDRRLVEIFRQARSSLEESGANTLFLAVGFLRWYETADAAKPRKAPLLLLPVVVERLSAQEGYRFVMDDAEPRVNEALLQLLQRDFELRVPLGEQLPEDEHGVDVGAVLDAFRHATLAMPRWEVESAAFLGFFSFTKHLMWRDLDDRDGLLESPVLRHLVEQPGGALPQQVPELARDELDDLDPAEVFCPKDADSSQLAAVLAGAQGRSFVLEGPPGTGKSQTITNLIAQSLATGKRVLFVAEKRAALEVVHHRLADVGLAPFCLELHSQKSGPKAVLEQLRVTLELARQQEPAEWRRTAEQLQQERTRLNAFVHALHRRREHGFSVHQAMARLVQLRDAERFPFDALVRRPAAEVAAARRSVEELVVAAAPLGVPGESAWWGVQRTEWTPAVTRDVGPLVDRLASATEQLASAVAPLAQVLGLDAAFAPDGPSRTQLAALLELAAALAAPSPPPSRWLCVAAFREFDADLSRAIEIGGRRDELWQRLSARWREALFELDLGGLAATYRLHAQDFVLWRWWRLRRAKAALRPVAAGALPPPLAVRDDLELALRVQQERAALAACRAAADGVGADWRDGRADWAQLEGWLTATRRLRQLVLQLVPGSLAPDAGVLAALADQLEALRQGAGVLPALVGALRHADDAWQAAREQLRQYLDLDERLAFGADDAGGLLARVASRLAACRAREAQLRDHCAWRRAADVAEQSGVGDLVAAHAAGRLATHALVPAFERSLYEAWLDRVHEAEPELARFRGQDHEVAIARFAELDQAAIRLSAKVVTARLCAALPTLRDTQVASSELGLLERELKKQRRHKPVRRLLADIRGLWPRLSPCVLMSPLSVAQFLGREAQRFDLVVFDEASQIPMWDAVGSIGRGDALIVVGDSRQLPPTSFFQRQADGDEPTEGELPEDLESVLDECGAAGLPRLCLDWHYRSRHESLIAFSNQHYYQNRLLTFPSPQHVTPGLGVRCVRVPGVYDRAGSQQNRIEAEALVAEVVRRLRDPAQLHRSIGVVTFSRAQQTLIEDLLDAERRKDPALDAALAAADEQLFVKNLENVQGDERDSILFSICYGPDAAGKVYEHYGPLNLQGGERRLNVAVTRARRELVVFTSLGAEQVANRSAALGARHLRNFLDYAERGAAALAAVVERDPSRDVESPFEAAVRDALVRRGHEMHTQIGCSGYRIDLAVVDPEAPGRYLLGVECDGASYHSAATARDRDRLRAAVLRGLGWQLVRVWSTDFWQDPEGELDRVEAAIEAARQEVRARDVAAVPTPSRIAASSGDDGAASGEVQPQDAPSSGGDVGGSSPEPSGETPDEAPAEPVLVDADGPRPFESAALSAPDATVDFQSAAALRWLREQARALLDAEGPIVFDRYARALGAAWGLGRVTERARQRARDVLPSAVVVDGEVLWRDAAQREAFRGFRVPSAGAGSPRPADELPIVEVEHAMAWLLRQHHALGVEDLARESARLFGIQRLGSAVRAVMERALARLLESGVGTREGELIRLST